MIISNYNSRDTDAATRDAASTAADEVIRGGSRNRRLANDPVALSPKPPADHVSRISKNEPIFAFDLAGPVCTAGRSICRLLKNCGENVWFAVVLIGAVIGLTRFATQVSQSGRALEINNVPDGGAVVRLEVRYLWLPEALTRLARPQSRSPLIRNHEELKQFLELRDLEDHSYALTIRAASTQRRVRRDHVRSSARNDESESTFQEFMDALATAAGSPPPYTDLFQPTSRRPPFRSCPRNYGTLGPRAFIIEQLGGLSHLRGQKHDR